MALPSAAEFPAVGLYEAELAGIPKPPKRRPLEGTRR